MNNRFLKFIKHPSQILIFLDNHKLIKLDDEKYIKIQYKNLMNEKLDLKNPYSFNQKLQWLKLHNRNEKYTTMVDKYEAKKYISSIIGDKYIIPTLGIFDSFEDIDFEKLPNKFVIKPTHTSGNVFICENKENLDLKKLKKQVDKWLKRDYYSIFREWPYKNVKPRILIEKFMNDLECNELRDYKFYCFNGECDYVMTCFDRNKNDVKFFYYDKNWNLHKNFSNDGLKYGNKINLKKPKKLDEMFTLAKKLSQGIPFVRVDFYEVNGEIYFGEMTFFPSAGYDDTRTKDITNYLDNKLKI